MNGLSQDTYLALCDALLRCGPVEDDRTLRAHFVAAPLHAWRDGLPEAGSPMERVNLLVDYLAHRESGDRRNALVLLLESLYRKLDEEDACHDELRLLSQVLARELDGAVPAGVLLQLPDDPAPYQGLRAFGREDSAFFFGRDDESEQLWEMVQVGNFAAVLGVSGAGKSSLVQAGLLPRLQRAGWTLLSLRPGSRPLTNLAAQLALFSHGRAEAERVDDYEQRLRSSDDGASTLLLSALAARPPETRLLLFVDQFEELFTLVDDEQERAQFAANLLELTRLGRVGLLVALRLDFLHTARALPGWGPLLDRHYLRLSPLAGDDLRAAIEEPARLRGARFEQRLVELIMRDAADRPGILPLVQVALQELWQRRVGPWLTYQAYDQIGGVGGAINRRADAAYLSLDEADAQLAQYLFLRLVRLDEDRPDQFARRRVPWEELIPAGASPEQCRRLVAFFSRPQLRLLTAAEETVELTHEQLIVAWTRLQSWLRDRRATLLTQQRLAQAARTWERQGRPPGYLFHDEQLAQTLAAVPPARRNALETAFLEASQAEEAREAAERDRLLAGEQQARTAARRVRRVLVVLAVLLGGGLLAYLAYLGTLRLLAGRANPPLAMDRSAHLRVSNKASLAFPATVTLTWPAFAIDTYEVSNAQYRLCVRAGRCARPDDGGRFLDRDASQLPVVAVSAIDAQRFCQWLGRRLPTEPEWVRAAYGEEDRPFPWGPDPPTAQRANLDEWGSEGAVPVTALEVGAAPPGIFNLVGNVWEWTATTAADSYPAYLIHARHWLTDTIPGEVLLVARGGSWQSTLQRPDAQDPRLVLQDRLPMQAGQRGEDLGFRCAQSIE